MNKLTDAQINDVLDRIARGESRKALAAEFGISRNTINNYYKDRFPETRGEHYTGILPGTVARYKEMAQKYDEGASPSEIAAEFKVCAATARKAIQQYGTRTAKLDKSRGRAVEIITLDPRFTNRCFNYQIIRRYRLRHGLSMAKLAVKIGVSEMTVTTWESGEFMPSAEGILKLQILFGLSAQDFLIEKGDDIA